MTDREMNTKLPDWHCWSWVMAALVLGVSLPVLLSRGPMLCLDWPVWWSICHSMKSEIVLEQKWLWGVLWSQGNGGMVLGKSYSLCIIVPWLLSYLVSVTTAQKVIFVVSAELVAVAAYCTARESTSRLIACVAGLLVLLRTIGLITTGMWYNSVSIALALMLSVALSRFLQRPTAGNWVFGCLMLVIAVYCHPLGAILGCAFWLAAFVYAVGHRSRCAQTRLLGALVLIPVTALLLAAPQLLSMVENVGAGADLAAGSDAASIESFTPTASDALRLCGLLVSIPGVRQLWRRDRVLAYMILFGLLAGYAIYLQMPARLPPGTPFRQDLSEYSDRFDNMADSLLILLMVGSGGWLIEGLIARGRRVLAVSAVMLSLGLVTVGLYLAVPRSTLNALGSSANYQRLCEWLRENVDHGDSRVYFEDTLHSSRPLRLDEPGSLLPVGDGRTHLFGLAAAMAEVQQVNGFWYVGVAGIGEGPFMRRYCIGARFFSLPENELRQSLRLLNCGFIVVNTEEARRELARLSFMEPAAEFGPFRVFRVRGFVPCWAWSGDSGSPIRIVRVSSIEYRLDTTNVNDPYATVSVAYAPRWHAFAGGTRLPVEPAHGLIQIALDNRAPKEVVLRYELNRQPSVLAAMVGLLFFVVGISWTARLSRLPVTSNADDARVAMS